MKSLASAQVLSETKDRLLRVCAEDRPLWGKMTATQMVAHLGCSCDVALGKRTVTPIKGMPPPIMKFLALRTGVTWPKNVPTTPELKAAMEQAHEGRFSDLLEQAVAKMEAVASGGSGSSGLSWASTHPIFGSMTAADWMRWGFLHTDHHLRQFGR